MPHHRLPDSKYKLGGSDVLMRALDYISSSGDGSGNTCHAALLLNGDENSDKIEGLVKSNAALKMLSQCRVKKSMPLSMPYWVIDKQSRLSLVWLKPQPEAKDLESFIMPVIDMGGELLRVSLCKLAAGKLVLLLSWQHTLLDAHGAELLLSELAGEKDLNIFPAETSKKKGGTKVPFIRQLASFRRVGSKLRQLAEGDGGSNTLAQPFAAGKKALNAPPQRIYLALSRIETEQLWEAASKMNADLFRSAFLLALSARSVSNYLRMQSSEANQFLVCVPHDQRKKGSLRQVAHNRLTVLFFRLLRSDLESGLQTSVSNIISQMEQLIKGDFPGDFSRFLLFCRRLPSALYAYILQSPMKQKAFASFCFSYTGKTSLPNAVGANDILDFKHYPPNIDPPGLSVVAFEHKNQLRLCLSFSRSLINSQEQRALKECFQAELHAALQKEEVILEGVHE